MTPKTIFLHDYAGHPFQAELSRALAARGHRVIHAFFGGDQGPKGDLQRRPGDAETLSFLPLNLSAPYSKSDFITRRFQDLEYGRVAAAAIANSGADIVISGNTPTEAQDAVMRAARKSGAKFIFWCQDFYSIAVAKIASKKLPGVGPMIGAYYSALERRQMRGADGVVLITEDFAPLALSWGVARERLHVAPNWGALNQISVLPKDNAWSREHDLHDKTVFLYSGTIGLKHNPDLLASLAHALRDDPKVRVVVVASGVGVERLRSQKRDLGLDNLLLLGLQKFERLPETLATADVLTAVIERDAGTFSVPSKVLSYLCAGRPILLAAPKENLAAKNVTAIGAGAVVDPDDQNAWLAAAMSLVAAPELRTRMGAAGRAYAEDNFDLGRVADRFEAIFTAALNNDQRAKAG
ncbi:MAG: glycosyltransferase family 4 protein [Alphaproteobacteria bacterium]